MQLPAWLEGRAGWVSNQDRLLENLVLAGLALVILTALNGIFQYFRGKWSAAASEGIAKNLRDELYDTCNTCPMIIMSGHRQGISSSVVPLM